MAFVGQGAAAIHEIAIADTSQVWKGEGGNRHTYKWAHETEAQPPRRCRLIWQQDQSGTIARWVRFAFSASSRRLWSPKRDVRYGAMIERNGS